MDILQFWIDKESLICKFVIKFLRSEGLLKDVTYATWQKKQVHGLDLRNNISEKMNICHMYPNKPLAIGA